MAFFHPEDPQVQALMAQQQAAMDKHQMTVDETAHSILAAIEAVPDSALYDLSRVFNIIANNPTDASMIASYYNGVLRHAAMVRGGICLGCGKNHDDELSKLSDSDEGS